MIMLSQALTYYFLFFKKKERNPQLGGWGVPTTNGHLPIHILILFLCYQFRMCLISNKSKENTISLRYHFLFFKCHHDRTGVVFGIRTDGSWTHNLRVVTASTFHCATGLLSLPGMLFYELTNNITRIMIRSYGFVTHKKPRINYFRIQVHHHKPYMRNAKPWTFKKSN